MSAGPRAAGVVTGVVAIGLMVGGCSGATSPSATVPPTERAFTPAVASNATSQTWTQYHANAARTAAVPAKVSLSHAKVAWSDDLGAEVRGQVLAFGGRIIAATEKDRVVALNPKNGAVLWSKSLGRPLTHVQSVAGCGDIAPLGITSTPVIDPATDTVYVVGEVSNGHGGVSHRLEGLSITTGHVRLSENVDPPLPEGEHRAQLLQRAGLALANGRVYIAYGGNDGDCGSYHGWVVGVDKSGAAHRVSFEVASDGQGGAIWEAGGAPAVDSTGNLYVSTGNANPDPPQGGPDAKKYTESVVELSPDLKPLTSYKDRQAGGDEDLATGNPVLLPHHAVFSVGKTDVGFVLRQSGLSKIAAVDGVCGSDPDGGPAYDRADDKIFVPCRSGGIQVIHLGSRKLGARLSGADSAPVLIGSHLWALDSADGRIAEFDASSGKRLQSIPIKAGVPVFNSPSTGLGLLLVPTSKGVTALH